MLVGQPEQTLELFKGTQAQIPSLPAQSESLAADPTKPSLRTSALSEL